MIARQIFRGVHTNLVLHNVDRKALLGELRKATGFSFTHCKKALEENDNDLAKAKQWLLDNAQKEGWSKAMKLGNRATAQGLIAMITQKNYGVFVEINCETDFVARNEKFHQLAEKAATAVLNHGLTLKGDAPINKVTLGSEHLKELPVGDGKCIADHTALAIGVIGENINLKRALCMNVAEGIQLFGCTHPKPINPVPVSFGKYGALIALNSDNDCEYMGTQLCQHIIGMRPVSIGDPVVDKPSSNAEDESVLLHQEFLLDPSLSVKQLLEKEKINVLDFVRYEVGENLEQKEMEDSAQAHA